MAGFDGFSKEALTFFRQLEKNNDRQWFASHKGTFESEVREPMIDLVSALSSDIRKMAADYVPEKPEKAIYRIYRDTRFSKDKTPYKTHIAGMFQHRRIPKNRGAGLYFQISHKEVGVAGGVYMPEPEQLTAIRKYLADHWQECAKLCGDKALVKRLGAVQGDSAARVPKGFETLANSPAAEWVRRKQIYFYAEQEAKIANTPQLYKELISSFKLLLPLVEFLNTAILKEMDEAPEEQRPIRPEPMF